MTENPAPALESYPCNQVVFRAATARVGSNKAKLRKSFFRRRNHDSNGLSCAPTLADSTLNLTEPTHGTITLHVGWVRDLNLGLDIVPSNPTHANIEGVPYREGEDRGRATFIAIKLAEIARSL